MDRAAECHLIHGKVVTTKSKMVQFRPKISSHATQTQALKRSKATSCEILRCPATKDAAVQWEDPCANEYEKSFVNAFEEDGVESEEEEEDEEENCYHDDGEDTDNDSWYDPSEDQPCSEDDEIDIKGYVVACHISCTHGVTWHGMGMAWHVRAMLYIYIYIYKYLYPHNIILHFPSGEQK